MGKKGKSINHRVHKTSRRRLQGVFKEPTPAAAQLRVCPEETGGCTKMRARGTQGQPASHSETSEPREGPSAREES